MRILKRKPRAKGWELTDPARNLKQARAMVKGGYGKDTSAIVVKTGKRGESFPYHIYTKWNKRR